MSDAINPDHYKRLPAEAIEIIEAGIDKAPSNQDAYLHGQVLKYTLRCWNKNGIEDLRKAQWYLDRLINRLYKSEQQKASDLQSLKDHPFGKLKEPAIKQSLNTEPPDGWRWLEVGEILRRLDASFNSHGTLYELNTEITGRTVTAPNIFIRRNRFEVGEKVIDGLDGFEFVVVGKHSRFNDVYVVRNKITGKIHNILDRLLAPYIEDTK